MSEEINVYSEQEHTAVVGDDGYFDALVIEHEEIKARSIKLKRFIINPQNNICYEVRKLMSLQCKAMDQYKNCLSQRIDILRKAVH